MMQIIKNVSVPVKTIAKFMLKKSVNGQYRSVNIERSLLGLLNNNLLETIESPFSKINKFDLNEMRLPLDIKETETKYEIIADIPGFVKEDIKITIKHGIMTISAEKKHEKNVEHGKYRRRERMVGSLSRSFSLPSDTMEDAVEAKYNDGVLTIHIEKDKELIQAGKEKLIEIK